MEAANKVRVRVLPADVFDALEFVAEAYGGIGAELYAVQPGGRVSGVVAWDLVRGDPAVVPYCVWGAQKFLDGSNGFGEVATALRWARIDTAENDVAVRAINARNDNSMYARVSFADWCAELGVVRGDA